MFSANVVDARPIHLSSFFSACKTMSIAHLIGQKNNFRLTISRSESSVLIALHILKKLCVMLYVQNMVCAHAMVLMR